MTRRLVPIVATVLVLGTALPAGAAETTSVQFTSAVANGGTIAVDGTVAFGDDALGPVLLAEDPAGDAAAGGAGQDLAGISVSTDLAGRKVTYHVGVHDMLPTGMPAPFYGYTAPIMVDGDDSGGLFLGAGNSGSGWNGAPQPTTWWALCASPENTYSCPTALTGTMDTEGLTIDLPFARAGIEPGSTIEPGAGIACGGVCSTAWAVVLFNNLGDDVFYSGYRVPGGVEVAVVPAGTPVGNSWQGAGTVDAQGAWSATVAAPAQPGDYDVAARACWGSIDELLCAQATTTITL